jgi:hypothetical protein
VAVVNPRSTQAARGQRIAIVRYRLSIDGDSMHDHLRQ